MDPRSKKPRDFVAMVTNMSEEVKKSRSMQIKWFQKYEPMLKEYKKLQHDMKKLYKKINAEIKDDTIIEQKKTCLPVPITTSDEYGWLVMKPEFRLEKYGLDVISYPNPIKDITLLSKNMPTLAADA